MCSAQKVLVLDRGETGFQKRIHIVGEDSNFSIAPSLTGSNWGWQNGTVHKCDFKCPSTWVSLIPAYKGCKATMLTFDDERIVVI
jgi:hypothetical protein